MPLKISFLGFVEPKIVVQNNMDNETRDQIIEWAIEGLELYGLTDVNLMNLWSNITNCYTYL